MRTLLLMLNSIFFFLFLSLIFYSVVANEILLDSVHNYEISCNFIDEDNSTNQFLAYSLNHGFDYLKNNYNSTNYKSNLLSLYISSDAVCHLSEDEPGFKINKSGELDFYYNCSNSKSLNNVLKLKSNNNGNFFVLNKSITNFTCNSKKIEQLDLNKNYRITCWTEKTLNSSNKEKTPPHLIEHYYYDIFNSKHFKSCEIHLATIINSSELIIRYFPKYESNFNNCTSEELKKLDYDSFVQIFEEVEENITENLGFYGINRNFKINLTQNQEFILGGDHINININNNNNNNNNTFLGVAYYYSAIHGFKEIYYLKKKDKYLDSSLKINLFRKINVAENKVLSFELENNTHYNFAFKDEKNKYWSFFDKDCFYEKVLEYSNTSSVCCDKDFHDSPNCILLEQFSLADDVIEENIYAMSNNNYNYSGGFKFEEWIKHSNPLPNLNIVFLSKSFEDDGNSLMASYKNEGGDSKCPENIYIINEEEKEAGKMIQNDCITFYTSSKTELQQQKKIARCCSSGLFKNIMLFNEKHLLNGKFLSASEANVALITDFYSKNKKWGLSFNKSLKDLSLKMIEKNDKMAKHEKVTIIDNNPKLKKASNNILNTDDLTSVVGDNQKEILGDVVKSSKEEQATQTSNNILVISGLVGSLLAVTGVLLILFLFYRKRKAYRFY